MKDKQQSQAQLDKSKSSKDMGTMKSPKQRGGHDEGSVNANFANPNVSLIYFCKNISFCV